MPRSEVWVETIANGGGIGAPGTPTSPVGAASDTGAISAAVALLYQRSSGTQQHRSGEIHLGSGLFLQAPGVEWNRDLRFDGCGPSLAADGTHQGTTIRRTANGNLFTKTAGFDDWNHGCQATGINFDGGGFTGHLLSFYRGGFNCFADNCAFSNIAAGSGYAVFLDVSASDLAIRNSTGAACRNGFFRYNAAATSNVSRIYLVDLQIDDSGVDVFTFDNSSNGDSHVVEMQTIKCETASNHPAYSPTYHNHIVHHIPNGNHMDFGAFGITTFRDAGAGAGEAILNEPTGTGAQRGHWEYGRIPMTPSYALSFKSLKGGLFTSVARRGVQN